MDGPEEAHLVAGAVEEVVAAVQQEGGEEPGEGAGPGEAHHSVLLVQAGVTPQHQHPRHQAAQGHQQPTGDARHTAHVVIGVFGYLTDCTVCSVQCVVCSV